MTAKNRTGCMITVLLLCGAAPALAQNTPSTPQHVPLEKTIGQAGPQIVPSLIVINAREASLQGGQLALTGVAPNSIIFADRPVRAAGHALTAHLLQEWESGSEGSFAKDPPNATVSAFSKDGSVIRDAVVVLKNPNITGDRLTFDVHVLEGDLKGADGAASVFIDIIGLPFTPLSYAGVARRTARRAAWYGAAVHPYYPPAYAPGYGQPYYPPPGYYPPPPPQPRACGYYPYPPCY